LTEAFGHCNTFFLVS